MLLFLVVSALWLVAAGTARAAVISQPPCARPPCPPLPLPSPGSLHVWLWLGIVGAVLILASLVLLAAGDAGERPETGVAHLALGGAAVGLAGVLAELFVVLVVTHVAIVAARLGFENSGEAGAAIAVLGVAQLPLAGALALAWARLRSGSSGESARAARLLRSARAITGLGGMVLSCAAFAAWSLHAGPGGILVDARLIAGTGWITNVGAWWPGLFAAMVALTLVAAACAPGITSTAVGKPPRAPSASEMAASPADAAAEPGRRLGPA